MERATEAVARDVAESTNSSYYAVIQPEGSRLHLSSKYFDPKQSLKLDQFLKNIDTLISIHGYGKEDDFWALLLGGTNREMAYHLAGSLREVLKNPRKPKTPTNVAVRVILTHKPLTTCSGLEM